MHSQVAAPATTLRSTVAAALVLLYAQPLTRIAQITLDDLIRDGGQLLLRVGAHVIDPGSAHGMIPTRRSR